MIGVWLALALGVAPPAELQCFSMHLVDGEAGITPDAPRAEDLKLVSDTEHAYWVRPEAVVGNEVASVSSGIEDRGGGVRTPYVRIVLTDRGRAQFAAATTANVGQRIAIVLNGRVLGYATTIWAPVEAGVLSLYDRPDLFGAELEMHQIEASRSCARGSLS